MNEGVSGPQNSAVLNLHQAGGVDGAPGANGPGGKSDSKNVTPGIGAGAGGVLTPVARARSPRPPSVAPAQSLPPATPAGDVSEPNALVSASRGPQGAMEVAFNEAAQHQTVRNVLLDHGAMGEVQGEAIQLETDQNVIMSVKVKGETIYGNTISFKTGTVIVKLENPYSDSDVYLIEKPDELRPLPGEESLNYKEGPEGSFDVRESGLYEKPGRVVENAGSPPPSEPAPKPGELVNAGELAAREVAIRAGVAVPLTAALSGAIGAQWDALKEGKGAGDVALATVTGAVDRAADAFNPIYHAPPHADLTAFDKGVNWARKVTASATTTLATATAVSAASVAGAPATPFLGTATGIAGAANIATEVVAAAGKGLGLSGKDQDPGLIYHAVKFVEEQFEPPPPGAKADPEHSMDRLLNDTPPIL